MVKRKKSESVSAHREAELIRGTTAAIVDCMKKKGVVKAELARRLGRTNAYVTQMLSGDRNLTLRTIADVALALETNPRVVLSEKPR